MLSYDPNAEHILLHTLLRIEQARHALIDRTTLPDLLERIASEIRTLLGYSWISIHMRDDLLTPSLPLVVTVEYRTENL